MTSNSFLYQLAIKSNKINHVLDGIVGIMLRVFGILFRGLVLIPIFEVYISIYETAMITSESKIRINIMGVTCLPTGRYVAFKN